MSKLTVFCGAVLLIILSSMNAFAQTGSSNPKKVNFASNLLYFEGEGTLDPYFISSRPVTNREYLLYLVWLERIYHPFPDNLLNAWPGSLSEASPENEAVNCKSLVSRSEDFVREYMFNPAYIDYPVIGISWQQAFDFCYWLTDRYNECAMIEEEYMLWDPRGQVGAESFITESLIAGQYIGLRGKKSVGPSPDYKPMVIQWNDFSFMPVFRLPSKKEFESAGSIEPTILQKYKANKDDFISKWWNVYIFHPEKKGYIFDFPKAENPVPIPFEKLSEKFPFDKSVVEWCLDSRLEDEKDKVVEIFKNYGMKAKKLENSDKLNDPGDLRKDKLGRMPYRVLRVSNDVPTVLWTENGPEYNPEIKIRYDVENNVLKINVFDRIFTCFRYAVSAER